MASLNVTIPPGKRTPITVPLVITTTRVRSSLRFDSDSELWVWEVRMVPIGMEKLSELPYFFLSAG